MQSAPIDLQLVPRLFSDPAKIAASDFLRREIAARMRDKLELVRISPAHVLDAGCGTGADLQELQKLYPEAQLSGMDSSEAMLQQVREQQAQARSVLGKLLGKWTPVALRGAPEASLLCEDFAATSLAPQSLDLIWSNLALHWHPEPDRVFNEWRRLLRTEGLLMFSCFGPDTFVELRDVFAAIDSWPHTLPFVDMHDFGDMLVNAGFSTPVMDMEKLTLTYDSPHKLLQDVRALGGNPLATRERGLFGRQRYQRLLALLEKQRGADGRIALSIEVVYGHAFKPVNTRTSAGESIVRFDLPRKK
jgi:malonyl-CoA O-methyltransferase